MRLMVLLHYGNLTKPSFLSPRQQSDRNVRKEGERRKKKSFIAKVDINHLFALFSACHGLFEQIDQSHLVFHMHRWKIISFLACHYLLLYSYLWWSYFLKSLSSWWSLFSVEMTINLNNQTSTSFRATITLKSQLFYIKMRGKQSNISKLLLWICVSRKRGAGQKVNMENFFILKSLSQAMTGKENHSMAAHKTYSCFQKWL